MTFPALLYTGVPTTTTTANHAKESRGSNDETGDYYVELHPLDDDDEETDDDDEEDDLLLILEEQPLVDTTETTTTTTCRSFCRIVRNSLLGLFMTVLVATLAIEGRYVIVHQFLTTTHPAPTICYAILLALWYLVAYCTSWQVFRSLCQQGRRRCNKQISSSSRRETRRFVYTIKHHSTIWNTIGIVLVAIFFCIEEYAHHHHTAATSSSWWWKWGDDDETAMLWVAPLWAFVNSSVLVYVCWWKKVLSYCCSCHGASSNNKGRVRTV